MNIIFKILGMIANSRNKTLVVSFGLGITTMSCESGQEIPVYVDGIYNQNEFILNQSETGDLLVNYKQTNVQNILEPVKYGQAIAQFNGFLNGKPKYLIYIPNKEDPEILKTYDIFFNTSILMQVPPFESQNQFLNQWVMIYVLEGFFPNYVTCSLNINSFMPPQNTVWLETQILSERINIENISQITTTGGFTFPATETKDIQIEMQKKDGTVLNSNKIKLNIIPYLHGSTQTIWGNEILTFND